MMIDGMITSSRPQPIFTKPGPYRTSPPELVG